MFVLLFWWFFMGIVIGVFFELLFCFWMGMLFIVLVVVFKGFLFFFGCGLLEINLFFWKIVMMYGFWYFFKFWVLVILMVSLFLDVGVWVLVVLCGVCVLFVVLLLWLFCLEDCVFFDWDGWVVESVFVGVDWLFLKMIFWVSFFSLLKENYLLGGCGLVWFVNEWLLVEVGEFIEFEIFCKVVLEIFIVCDSFLGGRWMMFFEFEFFVYVRVEFFLVERFFE